MALNVFVCCCSFFVFYTSLRLPARSPTTGLATQAGVHTSATATDKLTASHIQTVPPDTSSTERWLLCARLDKWRNKLDSDYQQLMNCLNASPLFLSSSTVRTTKCIIIWTSNLIFVDTIPAVFMTTTGVASAGTKLHLHLHSGHLADPFGKPLTISTFVTRKEP